MQNPLSYYAMLAKRWAWMIVLGIVICGGATYIVSKLTPPVYQASAFLNINLNSSTSAFDNFSASQLAAATYAQLLTNPELLKPVLAEHPGLTLQQLTPMVTAKPIANTSLIELDIENSNPTLSAQLANDICRSFAYYANTQLLGPVQIIPAERPINPIKPKALTYTGIGALVGFVLALSLIVIFEWMDDRLAKPEEVQELLNMDTLATIPQLSSRERNKKAEEVPVLAEECRILCAGLNAAQTAKPFKLVMITSALPGEGKSTIVANLASFLVTAGKSVLLIDADLRHPTLEQHFQFANRKELPYSLLDLWEQLKMGHYGQETNIPMLRVLTMGTASFNPTKLLQSPLINQLFDYFKQAPFDYIIFDTSPLLPVADAQVLASYIQATLLVIDASKTSRHDLRHAKQLLDRTRTMKLGIIINKSRWPDPAKSRHYLSYIQQSSTDSAMALPPETLPQGGANAAILDTPVVDDKVDPDITITIPRQRQRGEE